MIASRAAGGHRLWVALGLLAGGLVLGGVSAAQAEALVVIEGLRPARVFYPGERVVLRVRAAGELRQAHYQDTNYYGALATSGSFTVGGGQPLPLDLRNGWQMGIYYLQLTLPGGVEHRDAFCVIPRPDTQRGDYGVFSWHFTGHDPQVWSALAQAGSRLVRRGLGWPETEPQQGRLNLETANYLADAAHTYGMQLIPIVGYTPRWAGVRPANATGRVAIASHTWPPASAVPWRQFVGVLAERLATERIAWPTPAALGPQQISRQDSLPLVHSWEIWNEADQNFYYGYWARYVDLLRLAHGEIKRRDPWATVLYGGSTGHWTELGHTYAQQGQFFFDALAFHPGGSDLDATFTTYFTGAPQIGNGYGIFRPSVMTEAYPHSPDGLTATQSMMRLYATLLRWNIGTFCTFDGGIMVGDADPDSDALLWSQQGQIVPNARYVALANIRWLLGRATYVGPVDLGPQVTALMFLRNGRPLLICWAQPQTEVELRVVPGAYLLDEMVTQIPLSVRNGRARFSLGPAARAVAGVDNDYLVQAVRNQAELLLTTPQGFETDRNFGYIGPLERDAAWAWPAWAGEFRRLLEVGLQELTHRPRRASLALGYAQAEVNGQLARTVRNCAEGNMGGRVPSILWRLGVLGDWLGSVIDAHEMRFGAYTVRAQSVAQLQQTIEELLPEVSSPETGLTYPLGLQALQRARQAAQQAGDTYGVGAFRAARGHYRTAELSLQQETPVLTGVVAVADFPTATQIVRGVVFRPGETHELQVHVHNFTNHAVSGQVTWEPPLEWGGGPVTLPFTAPAGGYAGPLSVQVPLVAAGAWVPRQGHVPGRVVNLLVPESLSPDATLALSGELDDGRQILTINYPVLVGELVLEGQ